MLYIKNMLLSFTLKTSSVLPHLLHRLGEAGEYDAGNVDPGGGTIQLHLMCGTPQVHHSAPYEELFSQFSFHKTACLPSSMVEAPKCLPQCH